MFGISSIELIIILLIGVVVLGPERLPQVIRTVTKWMSQFRRITTELQRTINAEVHLQEHNTLKKEAEKELFGSKPKRKKTTASGSSTAKKTATSAPEQNTAASSTPARDEAGLENSPQASETDVKNAPDNAETTQQSQADRTDQSNTDGSKA